jgi:transposase
LPLYRQSVILAREGIDVDLADWMGHLDWWAMPLYRLIGDHVIAAAVLHTDDTPIRRLAPGLGRTVTARF